VREYKEEEQQKQQEEDEAIFTHVPRHRFNQLVDIYDDSDDCLYFLDIESGKECVKVEITRPCTLYISTSEWATISRGRKV